MKFLLNLCRNQWTLWDPSDPSYKNRNKRRRSGFAYRRSIWLARPDAGLVSFILGAEVTEDVFAKWAPAKSAKL